MREFRQLPIDSIHPSPTNPRGHIPDESLAELADSIRERGVLQPILVRANGEGYRLIAGERRWRASRLAGCTTIPGRVLDLDDAAADEVSIIENLHREEIPPLDEAEAYQRLLSAGRTIDELTARLGKSKAYIHQRVSLTRLTTNVRELVAHNELPLHYALKLAQVPADRQQLALAQCFQPLFSDAGYKREHLEPFAKLTGWIERNVRLDPRGEDTRVLLPTLAEQVAAVDEKERATLLALSTLTYHTDRSDPTPILANSWKRAEDEERCRYARPAVIEVGEGRGTFLHVCIEKTACRKHWPRPSDARQTSGTAEAGEVSADAQAERARHEQAEAYREEAARQVRWRDVERPRALQLVAEAARSLTWSSKLFELVLESLVSPIEILMDLLGAPETVPVGRYPQAMAMALALGHSSELDSLTAFCKQLGIKFNPAPLSTRRPTSHARQRAMPDARRGDVPRRSALDANNRVWCPGSGQDTGLSQTSNPVTHGESEVRDDSVSRHQRFAWTRAGDCRRRWRALITAALRPPQSRRHGLGFRRKRARRSRALAVGASPQGRSRSERGRL
jgi:ParB/RepB/Spo0J family partition protein